MQTCSQSSSLCQATTMILAAITLTRYLSLTTCALMLLLLLLLLLPCTQMRTC
jgi:hypothetical protein